MSIDQYSTTPASNDLVNYFKTGMRPSAVKNAGWDMMADIASYIVSLPTAGGTANALTVANGRPFGSLVAGLTQVLNPASVNTGPATFAPDGLAAKNIFAWGKALVGNELQIGMPAVLKYDGTQWNLQNPASGYSETSIFTTNGNFTPKVSGNYLVMGIGGGGGGGAGGAATTTFSGDGGRGGSGGQSNVQIFSLTAGIAYAVVIGTAGAAAIGGSGTGPDGSAGGNTTFNGITVSTGGAGGRGGGSGVTSNLGLAGGNGGGNSGGQGGASSAAAATNGSAAANNSGAGGGGGGGAGSGVARNGGNGAAGGTGLLIVSRV